MRSMRSGNLDLKTQLLYGVLALLLFGIAALISLIAFDRLAASRTTPSVLPRQSALDEFDGTIAIDPPQEMPDFTLTNQFGDLLSLSDLRGRYALLTFGYTNCPDVCPLTLNEFSRIHSALDEFGEQVAFVFISVDGERDTPQVIREYFATRQLDGIIGLTGDEPDVRALGVDFGLSFEFVEGTSASAYLVNHTVGSFLLDPQGRWIMRYQFGIAPSTIVSDLKALISTR